MRNTKREPAILAALTHGEWLTHQKIHKRLPEVCRSAMNSEKSNYFTCRRLTIKGKLRTKKIEKSQNGWKKAYALPEEESC